MNDARNLPSSPIARVLLRAQGGKRYLWCSCGLSKAQPFCDGSHAGTGFSPVLFKAERDEDVIFCGCKHTATPPFCDGAHSNLPEAISRRSAERREQPGSDRRRGRVSVVRLDGQCYVFSTSRGPRCARRAALLRGGESRLGALFQSQFYGELAAGASPVISADGRHTVCSSPRARARSKSAVGDLQWT